MHSTGGRRASRRRRIWTPGVSSAVAALVCALALVAWQRAPRERWPTSGLEAVVGERLLWIGPGIGACWCTFGIERADVVIVGDSRVPHAVHQSIASSLGIGSVAIAWGHGARTVDLLQPLLADPAPRTVVLALTPLGLVGRPNPPIVESLRELHPACDPESPPYLVERWVESELPHLLEAGFDPEYAAATMDWWTAQHRRSRAAWLRSRRVFDTAGLDLWLGHMADRTRSLWLDPIEPFEWQGGWGSVPDPHLSERPYEQDLSPRRAKARHAGAVALIRAIRELQVRGWRVLAVRLPVEPGMRAIEDDAGGGAELDAICDATGVPYLDFGAQAGVTLDGSHLNWRAADETTRRLAAWIRLQQGRRDRAPPDRADRGGR